MRYVCIVVPFECADPVLDVIRSNRHAFSLTSTKADDGTHVTFRIVPKHLQSVLIRLTKIGCGESYGTIDVLDSVLTRPVPVKENVGRVYSISDRMTLDEIEVRGHLIAVT